MATPLITSFLFGVFLAKSPPVEKTPGLWEPPRERDVVGECDAECVKPAEGGGDGIDWKASVDGERGEVRYVEAPECVLLLELDPPRPIRSTKPRKPLPLADFGALPEAF